MKYAEIGVQHFERKGGVSKIENNQYRLGIYKGIVLSKIKFHLKNKKLIN